MNHVEATRILANTMTQFVALVPDLAKLPEALVELDTLTKGLPGLRKEKADEEAAILSLRGRKTVEQREYDGLTKQRDGLAADVRDALRAGTLAGSIREREAKLAELDAAVQEKQATLDQLTQDVNTLKKKHALA